MQGLRQSQEKDYTLPNILLKTELIFKEGWLQYTKGQYFVRSPLPVKEKKKRLLYLKFNSWQKH